MSPGHVSPSVRLLFPLPGPTPEAYKAGWRCQVLVPPRIALSQ